MRRRSLPCAVAGLALLLHAAPALAQVLVPRADVYLSTRERWRGIRRNAHPLVQLDALAAVRLREVSLSAGVWGAVEPGDTRGEPRADLRSGTLGFSTTTAWGQLAASWGGLGAAAGVTRDWFRRVGGDPAVTELYLRLDYQTGRWAPAISFWQAVAGADGAYLEPSIAYHHFVNPFDGPVLAWTTTLRAGFQVGERAPDGGVKVPGPEETGLTHAGVGTGIRAAIPLGPVVALLLSTGPELQVGRDPATRRRRDGSEAAALALWWPVRLGLTAPFRRSR